MASTMKAEMKALDLAIEKFARELEFKGDVLRDEIGYEMARRIKKGGRRNEAIYRSLSRLYKVIDAYEQFKSFSAHNLMSEILSATEDFHERYSAAVEPEADDRELEVKKAKRAERARAREKAAA